MRTVKVNWADYATAYDLMAQHNPAYQELIRHCVSTLHGWSLQEGNAVADIGGGTGNFSIALARAHPSVTILHVDADESMLRVASAKADEAGLGNWHPVRMEVEQDAWNLPELAGVVTVHSLYVLKNPQRVIQKMCERLRPNGYIYACDVGRVMNVFDWGCYLFVNSIREHGLWQTAKRFCQLHEVRRQNKRIAACQRDKVFWTHELPEFKSCFENLGIEILTATNELYRGYDDLVVGKKSERVRAPSTNPTVT